MLFFYIIYQILLYMCHHFNISVLFKVASRQFEYFEGTRKIIKIVKHVNYFSKFGGESKRASKILK